MKPTRFKAARGQRLKPGQKLVGRNTRWGNPFPVRGKIDPANPPRLVQRYAAKLGLPVEDLICDSAEESVGRFRRALLAGKLEFSVEDVRAQLKGCDLGCPCADEACHAEVLIEIANS